MPIGWLYATKPQPIKGSRKLTPLNQLPSMKRICIPAWEASAAWDQVGDTPSFPGRYNVINHQRWYWGREPGSQGWCIFLLNELKKPRILKITHDSLPGIFDYFAKWNSRVRNNNKDKSIQINHIRIHQTQVVLALLLIIHQPKKIGPGAYQEPLKEVVMSLPKPAFSCFFWPDCNGKIPRSWWILLGCPRKLGSKVSKLVIFPYTPFTSRL